MHIFLVSVFRLSRVSSYSFSSLKQLPSGVHYIKYSKQKRKHFQELLQYSVFMCADPLSGTEDYHCSRVLFCFKRQNMEHEQLSKHLLSRELNTYNKTDHPKCHKILQAATNYLAASNRKLKEIFMNLCLQGIFISISSPRYFLSLHLYIILRTEH